MSRAVRQSVPFLSLALVALAIPFLLRTVRPVSAAARTQLTASDVEVAMLRAGLGPEQLAAAGASASDAAAAVNAFENQFAMQPGLLSAADAKLASLRPEVDLLRRKVRSGLASADQIAQLPVLDQQLSKAEAERKGVLDVLFASATGVLPPAQRSGLEAMRANAHWRLPIPFLVVERSQAEWVKLRDSLSNERICAKYADPVNPELAAFLAQCQSDAQVAAAKSSSDANLAAIELAFSTSVGD
jgi:hypothetical protein